MSTTLITGASSGIGKEFADQLAARGDDLVLVARRKQLLDELAHDLHTRHGITARTIGADLAQPEAIPQIINQLSQWGLNIQTLVNNAGFATHGDVADSEPGTLADEVAVNCQALVSLTAQLLPEMMSRHSGSIVNISSTAAFQPVPHMAVYAASKAFVLSFSEALWEETKNTGVRVLAACPGSTDTVIRPVFD